MQISGTRLAGAKPVRGRVLLAPGAAAFAGGAAAYRGGTIVTSASKPAGRRERVIGGFLLGGRGCNSIIVDESPRTAKRNPRPLTTKTALFGSSAEQVHPLELPSQRCPFGQSKPVGQDR